LAKELHTVATYHQQKGYSPVERLLQHHSCILSAGSQHHHHTPASLGAALSNLRCSLSCRQLDEMFLHAALDRFLTQMGNSYSGTKPALPTLNINKVSRLYMLLSGCQPVGWS
jgi:hypothetical protein